MTTFEPRGLHRSVVDLMGRRIIGEAIQVGETLDPDELETELQVSRTVIREAMKVLTSKGLVGAKPRRGTFVTQRSNWNLLDADIMRWRSDDSPDARLLRELDEVRQIVEPEGARLAAKRRTDDDLESIEVALAGMKAAGKDTPRVIAADLAFHRAVLLATHNELLFRLEVLLEPAMQIRNVLAFGHEHRRGFLAVHRHVFTAISDQDEEAAFDAMRALLRRAVQDTERVLREVAKTTT